MRIKFELPIQYTQMVQEQRPLRTNATRCWCSVVHDASMKRASSNLLCTNSTTRVVYWLV
jgi:hypothetical protein